MGITENVVDLMVRKTRKLSPETQSVLQIAACLGNQFKLKTLALVYEKVPQKPQIFYGKLCRRSLFCQ